MNVCGVYGVETCPCHKQQLLRAGRVSFGGCCERVEGLVIYRQVREPGRLRGNLGHMGLK
jgi:hypothetical protein